MGTQIVLVNSHRTHIPIHFRLTSSPVSFPLVKKIRDPGHYCSGSVLGIVSAQPEAEEEKERQQGEGPPCRC